MYMALNTPVIRVN